MTRPNIKLPFIHYRLELPELLQGVLMIAVGLSAVPVLQDTLGLSYEAALTAVALAEALGLLHVLFGDPVVPGWIASALPLVLVYMADYAVGIDSIYALIALQLTVSILFIFLGATGLAHKLMKAIPNSLKAGILFGAAIAAFSRVFAEGGYLYQYPLSVGAGSAVALFALFSVNFKKIKETNKLLRQIGKYGMLPSLVVAMAVGFISGEIPIPDIRWGFIPFRFGELFDTASVFSIGFPSLQSFLTALPTAIAVYVIAFGEIITAEVVLDECQEARPDEKLNFSSNRTNVIAGVRNLVLALFAPFTALAGPLWAAVSISIGERYKEGNKSMKSLFGGMGSFKLATAACVLLLPVASMLEPILPVALASTLVVQGFACSYIAFDQIKNDKAAAGTAGMTGAVVYISSLNWALAIGILSYLFLEGGIKKISFKGKSESLAINKKKPMPANTDKLVITIDQEFYSKGIKMARTLSGSLGIPCYEKEILAEASKLSGISMNLIELYKEKVTKTGYNDTDEDHAVAKLSTSSDFITAQIEASKKLSSKGPCILVNRYAHMALCNDENSVHIYIHAPAQERIKAYSLKNNVGERHSAVVVKNIDKQIKEHYRAYKRGWGNEAYYNISMDIAALGIEEAAAQIVKLLGTSSGNAAVCSSQGIGQGA